MKEGFISGSVAAAPFVAENPKPGSDVVGELVRTPNENPTTPSSTTSSLEHMSQAHPRGAPGVPQGRKTKNPKKRSFLGFLVFPQLRAFSRNDYPSLNSRLILSTKRSFDI